MKPCRLSFIGFDHHSGRPDPLSRGFTLVELLVAVTGGMFVAMTVFALAREGSRFYLRESRVAEATLGSVIGFDRLQNDIARAGFLSSPNVRTDPSVCGLANLETLSAGAASGGGKNLLRQLASLQITQAEQSVLDNPTLKRASPAIVPHTILLSGAYESVERFDTNATRLNPDGPGYIVRLQVERGALYRIGYRSMTTEQRKATLARLFPAGKVLRLFNNDYGTSQFATIARTDEDAISPLIILDAQPSLIITNSGIARCNVRHQQSVNVVNFIQYALRKVKGNADYPQHQQLFEGTQQPLGEDNRLELVREELYPNGSVVPGSSEVIAEYAVDLRFQTTCVQNPLLANPTLVADDSTNCVTLNVAGSTLNGASVRPQSVRSIRARLSVRSREPDRDANIDPTAEHVAPGLYRIGLGADGTRPFARVRTQQADIFLASQATTTW